MKYKPGDRLLLEVKIEDVKDGDFPYIVTFKGERHWTALTKEQVENGSLKRPNDYKLGEKIKAIRLNRGETMEEFGKHFSSSKGTISKWENGHYRPNNERLKSIADLAGISVEELLSGGD